MLSEVQSINRIKKYFIPPKGDSPRLKSVTIVGFMDSGKTTMAKSIYTHILNDILEVYDNPIGIYANSLSYLLENINKIIKKHDYFYIVIDDASLYHPARRAMSNVDVKNPKRN